MLESNGTVFELGCSISEWSLNLVSWQQSLWQQTEKTSLKTNWNLKLHGLWPGLYEDINLFADLWNMDTGCSVTKDNKHLAVYCVKFGTLSVWLWEGYQQYWTTDLKTLTIWRGHHLQRKIEIILTCHHIHTQIGKPFS